MQRGCHQVMGVRALSYYLQGQTDHMVKLWDSMVLPAAPAGVNIGPRVTSASPSGSEYWVYWERKLERHGYATAPPGWTVDMTSPELLVANQLVWVK